MRRGEEPARDDCANVLSSTAKDEVPQGTRSQECGNGAPSLTGTPAGPSVCPPVGRVRRSHQQGHWRPSPPPSRWRDTGSSLCRRGGGRVSLRVAPGAKRWAIRSLSKAQSLPGFSGRPHHPDTLLGTLAHPPAPPSPRPPSRQPVAVRCQSRLHPVTQ